MLENYDGQHHWDYPKKCKVAVVDGHCPQGQEETFANFPEALSWFLVDTNYRESLVSGAGLVPPEAAP